MAKLSTKLHGKEIKTIELIDGREYFAGRSRDCDLPLEDQKGISRNHFKIYQKNGKWTAELVSRYGSLIYEGEVAESVELTEGVVFQVPPYEFCFSLASLEAHLTTSQANKNNSTRSSLSLNHQEKESSPVSSHSMLTTEKHLTSNAAHFETSSSTSSTSSTSSKNLMMNPLSPWVEKESLGNRETTSPGVTPLIPYLRIKFPQKTKDELLELEGHLWVAGRDPNCEIPIEDGHVSRKHFELNQTNEGIYITDLGSANGTNINGKPLKPHEPLRLQSGDRITIMDLLIVLELRDPDFKNKLSTVNAPPLPDPLALPVHIPSHYHPNLYFDAQGPSAVKMDNSIPKNNLLRKFDQLKKNKIRLALLILAPGLLISFLFRPNEEDGQKSIASRSGTYQPFDQLSNEKKIAVRDIFNLARSHYTQGRYELCLAELNKLHEIIPLYEDSKTLQAHCLQGSEMLKENQELERKERAKIEAQQKILFIIEDCKKQLGINPKMDQAKECLGPAIELDPNHPGILQVLSEVQNREDLEKQAQIQAANKQAKMREGEAQYQKAKNLYKKGQLRLSIIEYEKLIKGNYPDLHHILTEAKKELSPIKKELETKVQNNLTECKNQFEKKSYKAAIEACELALNEDPNHATALNLKTQVLSDLRREMRSIYEDSALEESLGEIEGAKEKWRKIIQNDLESDEYYQKAKRKLQSYGIGI